MRGSQPSAEKPKQGKKLAGAATATTLLPRQRNQKSKQQHQN